MRERVRVGLIGTSVFAEGRHLVDVVHTDPTATGAKAMADALISSFTDEVKARTKKDIDLATAFYTKQRDDDQANLANAQLAQQAYRPTSGNDSQVTLLASEVTAAQLALNTTTKNLTDAQQLANSPATQTVELRDAPEVPIAAEARKKTSMLLFPIVGLFLAISLSAGLYALLLRTDNNIRVAEDLQALPGLLLLGTVPDVTNMKRRRWPRNFYRLALTSLGSTVQRVP